MEQGILFRGYSLPNISVTVAAWLDYSLSNTEASVWPRGWIIHCPIQKHLCGRVVWLFIVQYRRICVAAWLDFSLPNTEASVAEWLNYIPCPIQKHLGGQVVGLYSLSNTEASVQLSGWIIHCPIQKHLCSRVVGLFIVQYRSIWVAKCLVLWTSGQAMRKFSRRKTDGTFLTFPRKYDLTFHANCIQEK